MSDAYIVDSDGDSVPSYSYWNSTNEADYTYDRRLYPPDEYEKIFYSSTEYNHDLYYVTSESQNEVDHIVDPPDEYEKIFYSSTEYNHDLYYVTSESQYDILEFCKLTDTLRVFAYKYNQTALGSYRYGKIAKEFVYAYDGRFYLPDAYRKLLYSFTEYNQDLYYVPLQFQYDLLEFCKLTDTTRNFVYKYNQTVLFSFRYVKIAKEFEVDGLFTYEIPFRYLDTNKTLVSEFGDNSYNTDTIIQYYPDDSYMDIGMSDMDAIELYRQDVFSQYAEAGNTIFGDGDESDLIAICPVYDEPYSLITNVEIREIS